VNFDQAAELVASCEWGTVDREGRALAIAAMAWKQNLASGFSRVSKDVSVSRGSKIRRRLWAKEKICDHREQQSVCYYLGQRMKGAEDDVVYHPNKQEPARPIAAPEHKHSAKNREEAHEANPDHIVLKRTACLELCGVVCQSDDTNSHEQPTDDRDGEWTFPHPILPADPFRAGDNDSVAVRIA
jgi:hypothetical protein